MKNFFKKLNTKGEKTYLDVVFIVQVILIIAKLVGIVSWKWWVVILPTIIPISLLAFAVIVIVLSTHDFRKY